jgi:hypothetical protein
MVLPYDIDLGFKHDNLILFRKKILLEVKYFIETFITVYGDELLLKIFRVQTLSLKIAI